jgi:hypothetical protein
MAYKILNTDGSTLLMLADNTVNQSATSLSLVGKNINSYGQYINNNFVRLLANSASASSSPPRSPLTGQLWFDTTSRRLKVYDGTFRPVSGALVSPPTTANPPTPVNLTNPTSGDFWFDSNARQLNVWHGSEWTTIGPTFPAYVGENGWVIPPYQTPVTTLAPDNVQQFVTILKNYGATLGVISTTSFVTSYSAFTSTVNASTVIIESGLTLFNSLKVYNTVTSNSIVAINFTATNIVSTGTATSKSIVVNGTATSTSTLTGAVVVAGGVGIGGNLYVGGEIVASKLSIQYTTITNVSTVIDDVTTITNTTPSSSTITGALVVAGGLGVAKGVYVGGTVTATILRTLSNEIALGKNAGGTSQGQYAIAIGHDAGTSTQHDYTIAIGNAAGSNNQGLGGIAIGSLAGNTNQSNSIAIGNSAGSTSQQISSIAIGSAAGGIQQHSYAIAIGDGAGNTKQGTGTIAIGTLAGSNLNDLTPQGDYSIAIGHFAASSGQPNNSIVLDAGWPNQTTGIIHNTGTYITPIRGDNSTSATTYLVFYNTDTKELTTSSSITNLTSSSLVYATDNLIVGSTTSEGGQIVLGWAGVNNITGQSNSTWNVDVDSSNNLRIFSQNPSGSTTSILTASTSTAKVTLGGSVDMGKVLTLTVSTVAPASPTVGMFAVADRATWDPASKGSGNAYPVFYDGSAWNALY